MFCTVLIVFTIVKLLIRENKKPPKVIDCTNYALIERQQAQQRKQEEKEQLERQKRANKSLQDEKKRQTSRKQIETIELLQQELYDYLQALYRQEKALQKELEHTSEKRAAQINNQLLSLASKRASTAARIANNENRIIKYRENAGS